MDLLNGTYQEALAKVAEHAAVRRVLLKQAMPDLSALLADPTVRHGLLGAGLGAGAGALFGHKKHRIRDTLLGALGGGAIGAGGTELYKRMSGPGKPEKAPKYGPEEKAQAAIKSQDARSALGILGADEGKLNAAAGKLRAGELSPRAARSKMHGAVPGALSQLRGIPDAAGAALRQGRVGDMLNQADIGGLKQLNPFHSQFAPVTTTAALAANQLARHTPNVMRAFNAMPEPLDKLLQGTRSEGHPSSFQKLTGGLGPSLAFLAPLMFREWMTRGGYRGGGRQINDLVQANQVLGGR